MQEVHVLDANKLRSCMGYSRVLILDDAECQQVDNYNAHLHFDPAEWQSTASRWLQFRPEL